MSPDRDMPQSNINVRVIESIAHRNQPTMFNEENDMNYMRFHFNICLKYA